MAARPRVADIVAAAGLSNDAFYRHFPSKDALVAALLEDGAQRLARYVARQMSKETDPKTPEGQVRRWVEGVLSQTREEIAATTLAVLWNGGSIGETVADGHHSAAIPRAAIPDQRIPYPPGTSTPPAPPVTRTPPGSAPDSDIDATLVS